MRAFAAARCAKLLSNASTIGQSAFSNIPRVCTPDDKAIRTPNSDTPYSMAALDLRPEPMGLTIPPIEEGCYYSVQLIDFYTHNFSCIGSRTTGNGGRNFMIAGSGWKGEQPKGITQVNPAETELMMAFYRTRLFNPEDLDKGKVVHAGYKVQPLSAFLDQPAAKAAPAIDFIQPLTPETQKTSLDFFKVLDLRCRLTLLASAQTRVATSTSIRIQCIPALFPGNIRPDSNRRANDTNRSNDEYRIERRSRCRCRYARPGGAGPEGSRRRYGAFAHGSAQRQRRRVHGGACAHRRPPR